jgi:hypothetical protein
VRTVSLFENVAGPGTRVASIALTSYTYPTSFTSLGADMDSSVRRQMATIFYGVFIARLWVQHSALR